MKTIRLMTAAYAVFLGVIVLVADVGRGGRLRNFMDSLPGGDKTGHFVLMGMLAFLLTLSLAAGRVRIGPLHVLKGSLIAAAVVFIEECTQALLPERGFSLLDLAADTIGIVLFGEVAAWWFTRHWATRRSTVRVSRYSGKSGGTGGGTA